MVAGPCGQERSRTIQRRWLEIKGSVTVHGFRGSPLIGIFDKVQRLKGSGFGDSMFTENLSAAVTPAQAGLIQSHVSALAALRFYAHG